MQQGRFESPARRADADVMQKNCLTHWLFGVALQLGNDQIFRLRTQASDRVHPSIASGVRVQSRMMPVSSSGQKRRARCDNGLCHLLAIDQRLVALASVR